MRFLTAGESHGPSLVAILEGFPSGIRLDHEKINEKLWERQQGFGRGHRQQIEQDRAEILSGVRGGVTIGSPITLLIKNKDWENWKDRPLSDQKITQPRPGHADLAGVLKYGHTDIRNVLERASARETAARVAVGAVASHLLTMCGITITGYVTEIGGVGSNPSLRPPSPDRLRRSPVRCVDPRAELRMIEAIKKAGAAGDTVGGVFEVLATGVPAGLGSYTHWDRRLDGRLAQAVMSIQAIKGVEIGVGFLSTRQRGSAVHDEINYKASSGFGRFSHRSGGLEGGVTTGGPLLVRAAMKPISTLKKPLRSVDIITKRPVKAAYERSDVCAVPAASVVGEAMVAIVLADAITEKFGSDSWKEIQRNMKSYLSSIK